MAAAKSGSAGKTTGTKFRYVGGHAATLELEDGTCPQVGPGDYIVLSQADFDNLGSEFQADLLDATAIPDTGEEITPAQVETTTESTASE